MDYQRIIAEFLSRLRQHGYKKELISDSIISILNESEYIKEVADALLSYWESDPSLFNYAIQLNGANALFKNETQNQEIIGYMNRYYIAKKEIPSIDNVSDCYSELQFWNGLDMLEALNYFHLLSQHFSELISKDQRLSNEFMELLQDKNLSPQLKEVRRLAVDSFRQSLVKNLLIIKSPLERIQSLLTIAIGIGGARIINDDLWEKLQSWIDESIHMGKDNYFILRNQLESMADGQILDRPRETLGKINRLIELIDQKTQYGNVINAKNSLDYWRNRNFDHIPDRELYRLYRSILEKQPHELSNLRRDLPLMEGKSPDLVKLLSQKGTENKTRNKSDDKRKDGFSGRNEKKENDFQPMMKKIYGAIALVALIIVLAISAKMLSKPKDESKKDNSNEESQTQSTQTKEPKNSDSEKKVDEPEKKETIKPQDTPSEKKAEIPSLSPTPSSTPTPTLTVAPEMTPTSSPEATEPIDQEEPVEEIYTDDSEIPEEQEDVLQERFNNDENSSEWTEP